MSEIEGVFHDQKKTKTKETAFETEVSSSRWDVLILNPDRNSKLLDTEYKNLQKDHVIILLYHVIFYHQYLILKQ